MNRLTVSLHIFLSAFVVVMAGQALAGPYPAGDAEKGAKVFRKCVSCHMIGAKAKNRVGPHLNNIIGREIALLEDYRYSKAMKTYAETEPVWSEAALDAYLANPRKAVKGTRMSFAGLRKEKDRHDVIEYMKQSAE